MWSFEESPNTACFTTTHVMREGAAIKLVYHDADDGAWQFFSEHFTEAEDMMVVALGQVVERDPSVAVLADMPAGWMAQRRSLGAPWQRVLQYADAPQVIVDWSHIRTEADFYATVLPQCGAPEWHGKNLDALSDSWVSGGINKLGPPYAFGFFRPESISPTLHTFRDAVHQLAEDSIAEHGGRYLSPEER
ncbi:hypothetical protein Rhal01_02557 [Rubritalea halochordaticola]|uniref:Barstar (barnase inhibitor) domain-containing protein n=1 Tax=Rubritalea halochordaticola TaxID=714537 RepID=A0ABP9V369_9BACT